MDHSNVVFLVCNCREDGIDWKIDVVLVFDGVCNDIWAKRAGQVQCGVLCIGAGGGPF